MREKKYWDNRMERFIVSHEKAVVDYDKRLLEAYEATLEQIRKEIVLFYSKYTTTGIMSFADTRRRLTEAERKAFNTLLRKWYQDAQPLGGLTDFPKYLDKLGKKSSITRLEVIEATLRNEIEKLKADQYTWTTDLMLVNAAAAYYTSYYIQALGLEVEVPFVTMDKRGFELAVREKWDGRNYSDSIWADKDKLVRQLETILPRSFAQGLNANQLGDLIAKSMNTSKNHGRTLARTEINYLCNKATLEIYRAIGIKQYQFLATLDLRTSQICRRMDQFIGLVSQAQVDINYPPMHPNCRSTTIPYFPDDNIEDRIARDEDGNNIKVPRSMTQAQWINRYAPEDMREELLRFTKKYPL